MKINPILACDFYKTGHPAQYPTGLDYLYSNLTARSHRLAPKYGTKQITTVVVAGIQGFVKEFLIELFNKEFFQQDRTEVLTEYQRVMDKSIGPGTDISHIAALYDLGYLPLEIKALPEGSVVDMKVPLLTITNTVKGFGWLVNYIESVTSANLWQTITSASIAFEYKKILTESAIATGSPLEFVLWQGHDFSMRGVADYAKVGVGHLFSFLGTDTIPSILYLEDYYNAKDEFVGGSVPASEHSVASCSIINIELQLKETGSFGEFKLEDLI